MRSLGQRGGTGSKGQLPGRTPARIAEWGAIAVIPLDTPTLGDRRVAIDEFGNARQAGLPVTTRDAA